MAFFNNDIDYSGQDLHMLRNGMGFPLSSFFDANAVLNYEFRLDLSTLNTPVLLESINFVISSDPVTNVKTVTITALPNSNIEANERVDNFFVTVSDGANTACILY